MTENKPLGLGITVVAVIGGASIATIPDFIRQGKIERKVDKLLQRPTIELRIDNVIGGETPEKFYEIDGKRVYLEIDGKPVEQYFRERGE